MRPYAVLLALAIAPVACSGGGSSKPEAPCIVAGPALPYVQLAFPVSGATGVPTAAGTLIYASGGAVDDIVLGAVTASGASGAKVALKPAPLPSPLPSPLATPAVSGETYFAVSYPSLQSGTSYEVGEFAPDPCGPAPAFEQLSGTFTTQ